MQGRGAFEQKAWRPSESSSRPSVSRPFTNAGCQVRARGVQITTHYSLRPVHQTNPGECEMTCRKTWAGSAGALVHVASNMSSSVPGGL